MTCADVSFVVPTHNRPTYLAEAIASIRAQTISPREIIVVDNGNDGATASVLSPFAGSVRLVRSEYGSVQIARNTGFREANTTWVATLDDDDVLHPTFLQEALPLLDDRGVDIVSSDHRKFRGDVFEEDTNFEQAPSGYWDWVKHKGERTVIGRFPLAKLLQRIPVYPSTTIIRREFALSIGGYDPAMRGIPVEDIEFLVRALTHGNLGMVWKPLVSYRLHPATTLRVLLVRLSVVGASLNMSGAHIVICPPTSSQRSTKICRDAGSRFIRSRFGPETARL